jgi:hypothetical protein
VHGGWVQFVTVPVWDQSVFEPAGQAGSFSSCEGGRSLGAGIRRETCYRALLSLVRPAIIRDVLNLEPLFAIFRAE